MPEIATCECGCGNPAPIAKFNDATRGIVKGRPLRFIHGHWHKESVGYSAAHKRIIATRGKAKKCETCGKADGRIEWANMTGHYLDAQDYKQMCSSCHKKHDVPLERRKEISAMGNKKIQSSPEIRKKMSIAAKRSNQERLGGAK